MKIESVWGNPEKVWSFLVTKKPTYIEGHTLKTNFIRFLILFYSRKKFCVHFDVAFFHFFALFCLWFNLTKSGVSANKRALKHYTPLKMVLLASATPALPILMPKSGQNTTKARQDLHIPKYSYFHPSILALFLHSFFSITCCKWIFYHSYPEIWVSLALSDVIKHIPA